MNRLLLAAALLAGCATTTHWSHRDGRSGQQEFNKDSYECQRENTHTEGVLYNGVGVAGPEADSRMVAACLNARGWYQVD